MFELMVVERLRGRYRSRKGTRGVGEHRQQADFIDDHAAGLPSADALHPHVSGQCIDASRSDRIRPRADRPPF